MASGRDPYSYIKTGVWHIGGWSKYGVLSWGHIVKCEGLGWTTRDYEIEASKVLIEEGINSIQREIIWYQLMLWAWSRQYIHMNRRRKGGRHRTHGTEEEMQQYLDDLKLEFSRITLD